MIQGAARSLQHRPAMKVWLYQQPNGASVRYRSPFGDKQFACQFRVCGGFIDKNVACL
jgi:hypothetical protein